MARASSSALQELKQQLCVLMLPHTGVELVLQQAGSSAAVLHLPKVCWGGLCQHCKQAHLCCAFPRPFGLVLTRNLKYVR
jgi:hypothetical protein